jgi:hypothetical protein
MLSGLRKEEIMPDAAKPMGRLAWLCLVSAIGLLLFLGLYSTERSATLQRQWEPLCEGTFEKLSYFEQNERRGGLPIRHTVKVRYNTIHFAGGAQVHGIVGVFPPLEVKSEIVVLKNGLGQYRIHIRGQK